MVTKLRPHLSRMQLLLALAAVAGFAALAMPAAEARAALLLPPNKNSFFGVTDTGSADGFRSFARAVGRTPAVIQTFHAWGNSFDKSLPRWRELRARPVLHINTSNDEGEELITPRAIAFGWGDDYLLYLNDTFARERLRGYVRPLGEPNRCLNAYAAVDCTGNRRGGSHRSRWYRMAFQRMYLILHGGTSRARLERKLSRLGMPGLRPRENAMPRRLPKAPIAVIWSPLPAGSPRAPANWPAYFYPGNRFTDWIGTDFYSRYPHWRDLSRFYNRFPRRARKPFTLTEWGLWGEDRPIFVRRLMTWFERRNLGRMLIYYQDFGSENEFRIQNFPRSLAVLQRRISKPRYPQRAPAAPAPVPDSGGITPATANRRGR